MDRKFSTESWMAESFFLAGLAAPSGFCSGVSMSAVGMAKSWKIGGADCHGDRDPYFESQALNALSSVSPRLGSSGGVPVSGATVRC
jgi:hypothetical protein